jgi:hypothetical protein
VKFLVFLLLLANLLFYAFSNDYFGKPERPDAGRVTHQVQPERVRIVSRGEEPPLVADKAQSSEQPGEQPAEPAPPASGPDMAAADSGGRLCLSWEHLLVADADRLAALLGSRFPAFTLKRVEGGENNGWWIYIPPLANKAEADKKTGELRLFGVTDYFIVQEGPNRFAISLGVFSSEKGGQERLAELRGKGVRSARLMPRPGKDGTLGLQAEGPGVNRTALLGALSGNLKPAQRNCP